jgi:hypothetical protein
MKARLFSLLILFVTFGCVDRVFFDIKIPEVYGVSIDGYISDQPGPYRVTVLRTFDTESKENLRSGVSARVTLSDNEGNSEVMKQTTSGVYETSVDGIRGKVGNVYKVNVELEDGRIYESIADTLYSGATVSSVANKIISLPGLDGYKYFFEVYGQSSTDADLSKVHIMWRNKTTFKVLAHPEYEPGNCYRDPQRGVCNYVHPCTGLQNVGSDFEPKFKTIGPCTCCICWYDLYTPQVILSDKIIAVGGQFPEVTFDRVPFNGWYLMYKMRIEASTFSLSPQAFRFWKAVRDQATAVSNIFQPITGKITGNLRQVGGEDSPAMGLFYATSMSSKVFYIDRADVREDLIPTINLRAGLRPCFYMFPNSTTTQPGFWIE